MQDRPTAPEFLLAVAAWIVEDLLPVVPREQRFNARIAAHACAMVAREWEAADEHARGEEARLGALLGVTMLEDPDAEAGGEAPAARAERVLALRRGVARAIRAGDLDDRWEEAVMALRDSIAAKLAVAHPGYDEVMDDGR